MLSTAVRLAEEAEQAQRNIDNFLAPFVQQYGQFLTEIEPLRHDRRDFNANRFCEIEGNTFLLRGDEEYYYGEYYEPVLNLPKDFVENPQQFKDDYRKAKEELEAKAKDKKKADAQAKIATLEAQLARARKDAGLE